MKNKGLYIIFGLFIIAVILIVYFNLKPSKQENNVTYTVTSDGLNFKSEYEGLNDKYLKVSIKSYNNIVYSSYDEIFNILDGGTGIILFGSSKSNYTRSIIETLIQTSLNESILEIYYLDITNDRDEKKLYKGSIKTIKKGSSNYNKLLKMLNEYLPLYDGLNDENVKRIYLPTVVFVKNGKVIGIENILESYSERIKDKFDEMNSFEKSELGDILKEYYKKIKD